MEITKLQNGDLARLELHDDEKIVLSRNKLEDYRLRNSPEESAKIVAGYILQANALLSERKRIPIKQIPSVARNIIEGPAWKLSYEEISNVIKNGVNGFYGKFYELDNSVIGEWVIKYRDGEREAIFANKEYIQDRRRDRDLDRFPDGYHQLLKDALATLPARRKATADEKEHIVRKYWNRIINHFK